MSMEKILGIVRTALAFGAGILVSKGYFDQGMADQIVSAVIVLATAIWSIAAKNDTPPTPPAA